MNNRIGVCKSKLTKCVNSDLWAHKLNLYIINDHHQHLATDFPKTRTTLSMRKVFRKLNYIWIEMECSAQNLFGWTSFWICSNGNTYENFFESATMTHIRKKRVSVCVRVSNKGEYVCGLFCFCVCTHYGWKFTSDFYVYDANGFVANKIGVEMEMNEF